MSAGSSTYFCDNGHIVFQSGEDEIGYDLPKSCEVCGSSNIRGSYEWGAYTIDEHGKTWPCGDDRVPDEPCGFVYVERRDDFGAPYKVKKNQYNVSKLFCEEEEE